MITERFVPLAGVIMAGRERSDHPRVVLPAGTDLASEGELGRLADRIIAGLFRA